MQQEETIIIHKLQKHLKQSYEDIADTMIGGGIDNMEKYKYMMGQAHACLLYTSPSPRDGLLSRMPSSA